MPDVKRRFAKAFGVDKQDRIDAFFKGYEIVLRRNLERDVARDMQRELLKLGMITELEEEQHSSPAPAAKPQPNPTKPKEQEPRPTLVLKEPAPSRKAVRPDANRKPRHPDPASPPLQKPAVSEKAGRPEQSQQPEQKKPAPAKRPTPTVTPPRTALSKQAPRSRRPKQPGAPNFFDLRLSDSTGGKGRNASADAPLKQAPLVAAAIMSLAFVLVGLRFWAENFEAPAFGLGSVAVSPDGEPAAIVNDELILHERSGLDVERVLLAEFGIEGDAQIAFFSNGELLLLETPRRSNAPDWLQSVLGITPTGTGGLHHCKLDSRECTLLRDGIEAATILVEPHTDNILLADLRNNRLEKLTRSGERLALKALSLTPPVGLAREEGILYLTRGDLNTVSVLKPDTEGFATELDSISPKLDDVGGTGLIFPTALARLNNQWWVILQSRDATTAGLFRFDNDWRAIARVELPGNAQPVQLVPWAGKLLAPDPEGELIYRIAGDGQVEAAFNEEALSEALALRSGEIARKGTLQVLVLLILLLGAGGLFALGSVQSLQRKLYHIGVDSNEADFDINDENIRWLDPASDVSARLRYLGFGIAGSSALLLIGAFLAQFSAPVLLAIILVLMGLGGYYVALQRSTGCHLGLLDDQLIVVDHNNTYRVGRGPRIQYMNNFVMIDDVIVFLGTRLLPQFAGDQLHQMFEPVVTRGIKVDRTTLRLKMMNGRHPLLYGATGLAASVGCALMLLLLA